MVKKLFNNFHIRLVKRYRPRLLAQIFMQRSSIAAIVVIGLIAFIAAASEKVSPYDPRSPAFEPFKPPSLEHPFGTDDLGRDVFSRSIYGARTSLIIGLSAALIAITIGLIVGIISGYIGGVVDDLLMRITETFQVIPRLVLATVAAAFFGPSILNVILIIGGLSWTRTARVVRSIVLSLRELPYIEAARALGASSGRIMSRHILPATLPIATTMVGYETAVAILIEASLGFLGLSDPELESWGKIIHDGQRYFMWGWWIAIIPGVMLSILIVSINVLTDNISYLLNPKLYYNIGQRKIHY